MATAAMDDGSKTNPNWFFHHNFKQHNQRSLGLYIEGKIHNRGQKLDVHLSTGNTGGEIDHSVTTLQYGGEYTTQLNKRKRGNIRGIGGRMVQKEGYQTEQKLRWGHQTVSVIESANYLPQS